MDDEPFEYFMILRGITIQFWLLCFLLIERKASKRLNDLGSTQTLK